MATFASGKRFKIKHYLGSAVSTCPLSICDVVVCFVISLHIIICNINTNKFAINKLDG